MRMPGFTAETALLAAGRSYRAISRAGGRSSAISPSLVASRGSKPGCDPTCVCVTPEGCPCCQSVGRGQPVLMQESSTSTTCEPGSETVCEEWCQHAGGGMSSNPDGSTTCTVYTTSLL